MHQEAAAIVSLKHSPAEFLSLELANRNKCNVTTLLEYERLKITMDMNVDRAKIH
jgi:hypothetical protein